MKTFCFLLCLISLLLYYKCFRVSDSYNGERILDECFLREPVYPRNAFDRPVQERDMYERPPPLAGSWPDLRRNFEDEYKHGRDLRRNDSDRYRDSICESGGSRDYDLDRYERRGSRDRDYRGSHDRDYGRGDSDHDRGRRDDSWRRRGSRERRGSSRERDESPYRRRDQDRSRSRGHGEISRSRSRSPRGRSQGRAYREDHYDEYRRERSNDRYRDHYLDERNNADSSVVRICDFGYCTYIRLLEMMVSYLKENSRNLSIKQANV
jgi:RNA-binding protein 5/10